MLKRLRPDEPLTPHDVLMLLLEMSHEHQRESASDRSLSSLRREP